MNKAELKQLATDMKRNDEPTVPVLIPEAKTGAVPLTGVGYYEAFVLRRHGGAWQTVVIRVPGEVLDDAEFVIDKREPTRLENAIQWIESRITMKAQR